MYSLTVNLSVYFYQLSPVTQIHQICKEDLTVQQQTGSSHQFKEAIYRHKIFKSKLHIHVWSETIFSLEVVSGTIKKHFPKLNVVCNLHQMVHEQTMIMVFGACLYIHLLRISEIIFYRIQRSRKREIEISHTTNLLRRQMESSINRRFLLR